MIPECDRCGGTRGHRRWCPRVVGESASWVGEYAERAEELADKVCPHDIDAGNLLYAAAGRLRALAEGKAMAFQRRNEHTHYEDVELP